jgi:uncharacterized protein YbaP (TraB family)
MRTMEWIKRGLGALGLAALAGCTTAPESTSTAANRAKPALWRVSDPDTSIYLFGTFHLLPKDYQWQTPAIQKAVAKSNELIVETLLDSKHPEVMAAEIGKVGFAPNLLPLDQRINPALRPQLAEAIRQSGVPAAYFDKMKTWTAAFTLVSLQFKALGLVGEAGVEPHLRAAFESAGKPVGQLETNSEQLSFFDTLSEPAQRAFLEGAITDPGKMREEFAAMLKSWTMGDVAGIASSFNADLSDSPELRANLLTKRNQNWSKWIERRMAQPGTAMVAVGAGHLAGNDSVIAMLQRDGYKVQRVE